MLYYLIPAFIIRHFFCDYFLQPVWMTLGKRKEGSEGLKNLFWHSGINAFGTYCVLIVYISVFSSWNSDSFFLLCLITTMDFVLHAHIDLGKIQIEQWFNIKYKTLPWAILMTVDQLAHFTCYGGYIYLLWTLNT